MDWEMTYKDLMKKIVCNPESNKCVMHRCESCPGTAILKEFLDQKLNEHEDDEEFNYCQWDTTDRATLTNITATYEEYKQTLIDVINDLTIYSSIAKCQAQYLKWQKRLLGKMKPLLYRILLKITSSWYRTKSKATTGVKNIVSYIPCLYTTCDQMVATNMIHCVLFLMTTTMIQVFCVKFKQCLLIILKLITHIQKS